MKGLLKLTSSLIPTLFFLHGCGGSSSAPDLSIGTPINNNTTELEGTWKKSCSQADLSDPDSHYDIVTLTFAGNEFFSDIENYEDSTCATPLDISPNPTASGTFELGAQITATDGTQAREIDSHIDTYDGAPFIIDDYAIYRIDTDILYSSDNSGLDDGSSPARRPHTLDYTRSFYRQ